MPEQDIENIDSLNDAEVNDTDETGEGEDPTSNPNFKEYWENKVNKLEETNKKLYARLKSPSPNKPLGQAVAPSDERFERLELKTEGFTDEEIEFIRPYGGKKALDNPYIKTAIDTMREKRKAESAVVDVDTNKSDIEKKFTEDQLRNLPLDELEKLLPKA